MGAGMRMGGASGPSCTEGPWWRSLYPTGTPAPPFSTSVPLMSWTTAWGPLPTPWSWAATAWATSSILMAWSTTPKVRAVCPLLSHAKLAEVVLGKECHAKVYQCGRVVSVVHTVVF